jgi:hypothetical protein
MAVKLIANYSKRLGLPGYSSHQFSVSVETEVLNVERVEEESNRLYQLLQDSVDREIQATGFVPPDGYGMNGNGNGHTNGNGSEEWSCSDKQRDLILKLVGDHNLDKHEVEDLSHRLFQAPVKKLNRMQASNLIDQLLEMTGSKPKGKERGRFAGARK